MQPCHCSVRRLRLDRTFELPVSLASLPSLPRPFAGSCRSWSKQFATMDPWTLMTSIVCQRERERRQEEEEVEVVVGLVGERERESESAPGLARAGVAAAGRVRVDCGGASGGAGARQTRTAAYHAGVVKKG